MTATGVFLHDFSLGNMKVGHYSVRSKDQWETQDLTFVTLCHDNKKTAVEVLEGLEHIIRF